MASLRLSLAWAAARLGRALDEAYAHVVALRSELMVALVPPESWRGFAARHYDASVTYRSAAHNHAWFAWEELAVSTFFPPAPARLLVAGCGGGREMHELARRGYEVAGFDPAPGLVELARAAVPAAQLLCCELAAYEDLANGCRAIDRHAPYDAVILGWGSLSHVGDRAARAAILSTLRRLSPRGPVLASWLRGSASPSLTRQRLQRALRLLGSRRQSPADTYLPAAGFVHLFTREEIESWAKEGGYQVLALSESSGYPHAVLAPKSG